MVNAAEVVCSRFAPPSGDNITILLIDDDEVDIMGIERAFRVAHLRNRIVVAEDGVAALEVLRDGRTIEKPFLILLDLNMPRMNGIEFLVQLRSDPKLHDSLVFVLTTSKASEDKHNAYRHNIAGYMVKERANEGFISAAELLNHYQRLVEFP